MSDTESFEQIYERTYPRLRNPCGLWKAATIAEWLDDLQAAHDRELAQARDPQRLRGTKPDTFDGALEALREFRWQHATNDEDAIPYINALKEMHDREIEDAYTRGAATTILQYEQYNEVDNIRKQEYHRGFEDGKHSMDAEHYAVALRLKQIPLDGGSHENLSQIAKAIWHNDFGWTQDACAALRDELVRLMGGVSKPNFADQAKDLVNTIIEEGNRKLLNDRKEMQDETEGEGGTADDCGSDSDCGYRSRDFHVDGVMYDVLGNERQKAIVELRKLGQDNFSSEQFMGDLLSAVDADWIEKARDYGEDTLNEYMRDRLIHLLGGDQPSGNDVLRAMDNCGHSRTCPKCGEEMSESAPSASITDELRKYVASVWDNPFYVSPYPQKFIGIADRIDERARLGAIKADIWQDYANKMRAERDELQEHCRNQQKQLAEFNRVMNTWHWDAENHKQWCPMSLDREVRKAEEKWESACGKIGELKDERDDLKMRLREFADGQKRERKYYQRRIKKLVKERDAARRGLTLEVYRDAYDELEEQRDKLMRDVANMRKERDRYKAACEAAQSLNRDMMDGQQDCIELPKDADDVPINLNDIVQYGDGEPFEVSRIALYSDDTVWVSDGDKYGDMLASQLHHVETKADTAESIVRELTLGSITETQAIERIEALRGAK